MEATTGEHLLMIYFGTTAASASASSDTSSDGCWASGSGAFAAGAVSAGAVPAPAVGAVARNQYVWLRGRHFHAAEFFVLRAKTSSTNP